MDENNFTFELSGHLIIMLGGELTIDGASYEEDPEDIDDYDLCREIAKLRGLYNEQSSSPQDQG